MVSKGLHLSRNNRRRGKLLTSKSEQPTFLIIHDYNQTPGECLPGEETIAIILVFRGKRYRVPWGPTHMILVEFLCKNRFCAHDATWIAAHMQLDPYVTYHGSNAPGHIGRLARTTRTAVRQQIKRIREALTALIEEEDLDLDAWDIVQSEKSSTKVVRYRLVADVQVTHWPEFGGRESADIDPNVLPIDPGLFNASSRRPDEIRF